VDSVIPHMSGDSIGKLELILKYVEFVFPRNTFAPILMAFALENIVSAGFSWYFSEVGTVAGWGIILVVSFLISTLWGVIIGDKEELEDEVEKLRNE